MKEKAVFVLVIEEHPLMRESLCLAIETEPDLSIVETAPCESGAIALRVSPKYEPIFLTRLPDLILWSLGNPGLEDLQALEELSRQWTGTPILALTRDEVPGQEQDALAHGAQAAIAKSASRGEILQALRALQTPSQPRTGATSCA